ncbi:defensin-like isoform X4 [Haemaphysalis longicornis]
MNKTTLSLGRLTISLASHADPIQANMKILAVALIFVLVAAAAQDDESDVPHVRVRRGFGCPFNQGACHSHCRSIGRRGGYCAGIVKQTCTCYRK